ncbi:MAG: hypothetical protein E6I85_12075 [Chloroflexi bacterium]|nr:MAG: hypothetical protein E6I85_12075 [Chloroflexota bacterium]
MSNLTAALVVVIALLGGFYGGFRYESGKIPASAASASTTGTTGTTATGATGTGRGAQGGANGGGANGGAFGGGFAGRGGAGTITNLTSSGFTLHSANGTDVKVTLASGATVRKTVDGALSDLQNNLTVTVTGQRDASGNITATAITIVPAAANPTASGG